MHAIFLGGRAVLALNAPALGQTTIPFTTKMFRVSRCDAQANVLTSYPICRRMFQDFIRCTSVLLGRPIRLPLLSTAGNHAESNHDVDFTNITHKVMNTVVWGLVANGRLVAEASDVGTFSPGAEIKHKYG